MRTYRAGAVVVVAGASTTEICPQARARAGASSSKKMQPASRRERPEPFPQINNNYSLKVSIRLGRARKAAGRQRALLKFTIGVTPMPADMSTVGSAADSKVKMPNGAVSWTSAPAAGRRGRARETRAPGAPKEQQMSASVGPAHCVLACYVVQSMWCNMRDAIDVVPAMWRNLLGAI